MNLPYYEVLAFTDQFFAGNPAGVCLLNDWLPDDLMQKLATENNLAETAFLVDRNQHYELRWMTPAIEIDLCGHATLGSAHVIFNHLGRKGDSLLFQSRSGELRVDRNGDRLVLDFPSQLAKKSERVPKLEEALRASPGELLRGGRDYFAVFENETQIASINPDFEILMQLDALGVVVTAPGDNCDFVSRYFAPRAGIPEDPVTGSTHCVLIPYWAKRLGKRELHARQLSKRGGELFCEDRENRVGIGGYAVTYLEGHLRTP